MWKVIDKIDNTIIECENEKLAMIECYIKISQYNGYYYKKGEVLDNIKVKHYINKDTQTIVIVKEN